MLELDRRTAASMRWTAALIGLLVADVAVMVVAAATGQLRLVAFSAACFAAALAAAAVLLNRHWWAAEPSSPGMVETALAQNLYLGSLAWLWGALCMQGVYLTPLTGLKWQHAWQYALAMLLVAWCARGLARRVATSDTAAAGLVIRTAPAVATLQALGGATGALFLVASGKAFTWRPDWAANQIFLFGALLVMVLGAVTLHTHRRLRRGWE